jgi:tRNA threonylcarbamoyladenosine biosynthesis protein TsaB
MNEPLILHIETATDICSVAISAGVRKLSLVESGPERSHASLLSRFIRQAVSEAGKELSQLDAISVSKGPGSYTGLRIGVSTAKGIAYALQKPLLATGTLHNLAAGAAGQEDIAGMISRYGEKLLLCPMLDARRMEVYASFCTPDLRLFRDVSADIIDRDSYAEILNKYQVCFFGNGAGKCRDVLSHEHAHFIEGIHPSAAFMIRPVLSRFSQQKFEDVAYFEPFYLKDFVATKPRKKVL